MIKAFEFTKDYKRSNIYANLNPLNVNIFIFKKLN